MCQPAFIIPHSVKWNHTIKLFLSFSVWHKSVQMASMRINNNLNIFIVRQFGDINLDDQFFNTLKAVYPGNEHTLSPEVIDERLRELQKELVKMANQKDDYNAIADEILRLRDMRKQAEVNSVVKDEQMRLIQDLQDFIKSQPTSITEFDEVLVKRLITKITVFEDHFTIDFKSGVTIDIEA